MSKLNNGNYSMCGMYLSSSNRFTGLISQVDSMFNIVSFKTIQIGYKTFPLQIHRIDSSRYNVFGVALFETTILQEKVKTFMALMNADSLMEVKTFSCSGFQDEGGCQPTLRNVISQENGYLLICNAESVNWPDITNLLLINIDYLGNEIWRKTLSYESTSVVSAIGTNLFDDHTVITYSDFWFKPFKNPESPNYPLASENLNANIFMALVDSNGSFDTSNLKNEVRFVGNPEERFVQYYSVNTKDSGVVIVGYVIERGSNGVILGAILKLDKFGKYKWLRHHQLNINGGSGREEREQLKFYGVTELNQGGFAVCGEYVSDPTDKYPNGTQKAVVMFLDEFGCFEPGCQLKDGIQSLNTENHLVTAYPNPSHGSVSLKPRDNRNGNYQYKVFDALGIEIQAGEFQEEFELKLENTGMLFIKIINLKTGEFTLIKQFNQ